MKPLKNNIIVDYKPQINKELESGIIVPNEDAFDFLELDVISVGDDCKEVKNGDKILIRKESLFQAEAGNDWMFFTREDLVLKSNFQPIGNKVVLKMEDEVLSPSGLVLEINKKSQYGQVISIGSSCQYVKLGDRVLKSKHSGLEVEGKTILTENEILAIVNI